MKKTFTFSMLSSAFLQIKNTLLNHYILIFCYIFISQYNYAQQAHANSNWKITNPFYSPVFIENKGQFDMPDGQQLGHVMYGINNGELKVYFTPSGLSYHITNVTLNPKYKNDKHEIFEEIEQGIKKNGKPDEKLKKYFEDKSAYVKIQWEGANPDAQIVVSDKVHDVYSYLKKDIRGNSIVAPAFKKLWLSNLHTLN